MTNDTTRPGPTPDDHYRPANLESLVMSDGEAIVLDPSTGVVKTLDASDLDLLARCSGFRSIEEHAANICRSLGHDPSVADDVADSLRELADAGLLEPKGDGCRRWAPAEDEDAGAVIESVAMVTRDRVLEARRGLSGVARNLVESSRRCELVLIDDSRREESVIENDRTLQDLSASTKLPVRRIGLGDRTALVDRLAGVGVPDRVSSFALFGAQEIAYRLGAVRNCAQLFLAGSPYVSLDDDMVCETAGFAGGSRGGALRGKGDPTDFQFFESVDDAFEPDGEFIDLAGRFEKYLGRGIRGVAATMEADGGLDLSRIDQQLIGALDGDKGRVAIASPGLMGDSGMSGFLYFLYLEGLNRERLIASEDRFGSLVGTRFVRRGVTCPTLSASSQFMAGAFAVDNRPLLPPFFPNLRNSDGVFGWTMRTLLPDSYIVHLPLLIGHVPGGDHRSDVAGAPSGRSYMRISDIIMFCLGSQGTARPGGDPAERMRAMGHHLMWLGSLEGGEFESFVREHWSRAVAGRARALDGLLERYDWAPDFWASRVEEYRDGFVGRLARGEGAAPEDIMSTQGLGPAEAMAFAQGLVTRYGELLCYWPEMVAHCVGTTERR